MIIKVKLILKNGFRFYELAFSLMKSIVLL